MTAAFSRVSICLSTWLLMLPAVHSAADTAPADSVARVTVSGVGEAAAAAARATLSIGIQTQGATAAAAGADGARLAGTVTAALRTAGLPPADLKSTHLAINPQWVYDEHTHQQRRTVFQADTTLIINTAALDKLGAWVDAALSAGATNVSDPSFAPADDTALRHLALSRAVQNARGDAEVLASAAGGSLGALLQINQGQGMGVPMALAEVAVTGSRRMQLASPTNIVPDEIHVTATVTGMWRYIAGPGASSR
jgi:uncharacterized protein YggE